MENKFKEALKSKGSKADVSSKKGNRVLRSFVSLISGSFLSNESTLKKIPFIFFLSFVALCYIANGYYADDQIRSMNILSSEIKELRTQYIVIKDSLVIKSKQTEVAKTLEKKNTGIKESIVPPRKIVIQKITQTKETN